MDLLCLDSRKLGEGSPDSSGVEVSELADEGEQGPTS